MRTYFVSAAAALLILLFSVDSASAQRFTGIYGGIKLNRGANYGGMYNRGAGPGISRFNYGYTGNLPQYRPRRAGYNYAYRPNYVRSAPQYGYRNYCGNATTYNVVYRSRVAGDGFYPVSYDSPNDSSTYGQCYQGSTRVYSGYPSSDGFILHENRLGGQRILSETTD